MFEQMCAQPEISPTFCVHIHVRTDVVVNTSALDRFFVLSPIKCAATRAAGEDVRVHRGRAHRGPEQQLTLRAARY